MPHAGDKYVVGLQIEMYYLMLVQIVDCTEQLTQEACGMATLLELIRMMGGKLLQRVTVDVVHQHTVVGLCHIAY